MDLCIGAPDKIDSNRLGAILALRAPRLTPLCCQLLTQLVASLTKCN